MSKLHLFCFLSLSFLLMPPTSNAIDANHSKKLEFNSTVQQASNINDGSDYQIYSKKLFFGNNQTLRVVAKNGNAKLGYMDASVKATKFYSKKEKNFFVLLNLETSSTPGLIAHRDNSSYEDGWKTKSTKITVGVKPDRSNSDVAYEYAGPVSSYQSVTISSNFGSIFDILGTVRANGLSLDNNFSEGSTSVNIWEEIQTTYERSEPRLSAQFDTSEQTKKQMSYSWLYDFNWDFEPSMVTTYTYESFLFEVNPKYTLSITDFGVYFTLDIEMICDKDWFAGDHGSSRSYTLNI